MYLHLELKTMATERLGVAVARLNYLHTLMSKTPGFVDAQICEFLGNPGQYLVTRTWQDQASHQAYRQSDASKEFAASRPGQRCSTSDCVSSAPSFASMRKAREPAGPRLACDAAKLSQFVTSCNSRTI